MYRGIKPEIIAACAVFIVLIQALVATDKAGVFKRLPIEQARRFPGKIRSDTETTHIAAYDQLELVGNRPCQRSPAIGSSQSASPPAAKPVLEIEIVGYILV